MSETEKSETATFLVAVTVTRSAGVDFEPGNGWVEPEHFVSWLNENVAVGVQGGYNKHPAQQVVTAEVAKDRVIVWEHDEGETVFPAATDEQLDDSAREIISMMLREGRWELDYVYDDYSVATALVEREPVSVYGSPVNPWAFLVDSTSTHGEKIRLFSS